MPSIDWSLSSTIVNHLTTTLFTVTNAGINIFGDDIEWFTLRVSHTKMVLGLLHRVENCPKRQAINDNLVT